MSVHVHTENPASQFGLQEINKTVQEQLEKLQKIDPGEDLKFTGTFLNPPTSCKDIPPSGPSGEYWIQTNRSNTPI